ncbi:GGDEF domain-containing protein [Actinoplanes sp. TBRC 11911]|uniref:GGDEF domain-containing protein n=1 Tax=Actinoplanes sp. TBRC 11911 TaxID=2729386 RepID=UPI00145FBC6D|nr:GGDEF domain-containing protein [Actinoplanes sp. TBRC 11911]NMO52304.1 GGDEF domain-containing protein [Actinoplanes sp. TBRC 11911]
MVKLRWVVALPCVVFGILAALRLSDPFNTAAAGAELMLLQLFALGYHVRAATRRGRPRAARRPWWLVAAALAVLIAAGVGFMVVFTSGDKTWSPAMVLAIAGRLALVPLLLAALLSLGAAPGDRQARRMLGADVITVLGAGLMLMWYLVLGPVLEQGGLLDPLRLGSVLFAVGDVVLLIGVWTALTRGSTASNRRPLTLLLGGTLGYLLVDCLFLYQSVHHTGSDALVPGLLQVPIFLIMLAAIEQRGEAGNPEPHRIRRSRHLPYLAVAAGHGLLIVVAIRTDIYPWLGLVIGALLITLGVAARQILASRENYSLVITDSLTGLANRLQLRAALADAVERNRRAGTPVGVLLIDLDEFKQINDVYGHDVGDRLLVSFGDVLRRSVRASDLPARLGGDEFAVVLPRVESAGEALAVAQRILDECRSEVTLGDHTVRLSASIGVAVSSEPCEPDELLRRADVAMYTAKRGGKNDRVLYAAGRKGLSPAGVQG